MGATLLPDDEVAEVPRQRRGTTTSLPADLVLRSCRRVGHAALVIAAGWLFVIVANTIALRLTDNRAGLEAWPMPGYLIAIGGMALALVMAAVAGRPGGRPEAVLNLGLAFEVATGALIAVQTQWEPTVVPMRISWLCVLVVLYPAIVPHEPKKTLLASLLTVSMDPLFFWISNLLQPGRSFEPVQLVWMFVPNYTCALLATVPASIIRKLGAQVKKARELGNYGLGSELGRGGMGEVYRAHHRLLARPAAIKLIRHDLLGTGDSGRVAIERFRREAQAAALLRSPHTIALYDFGSTSDGTFYYAMELLDGLSLEQLVERFGPVPPARAINLVRQACESIGEAHALGLVHRDIKPSNLMAVRLGLQVDFVKVLDFGLVKRTGPDGPQSVILTAPDMATGSPAFMAPEAAMGEKTADHRVDIYSLGCVLYWLLTGKLVFESDTPQRILIQHIMDEPVPPSQRTELPVPEELDALVLSCLAKKPDRRPSSARELSDLLKSVPLAQCWNDELAEQWWDQHLPVTVPGPDERFDLGVLVPDRGSA